jgi:hypothetical protein
MEGPSMHALKNLLARSITADLARLAITTLLVSSCGQDILSTTPAEIRLSPNIIDFGHVPLHELRQDSVLIENVGGSPLELAAVLDPQAASFGFSLAEQVPDVLAPGQSAEIQIIFNPQERGPAMAKFFTQSNDLRRPMVWAELYGNGIGGQLCALPNELEFGDVVINTSKTLDVLVENCGDARLVVHPQTNSLGDFSLSSETPIQLEPGDQTNLDIRFAPQALGHHANTLDLDNPQSAHTHHLELRGNAIIPTPCIEVSPGDTVDFETVLVNDIKTIPFELSNCGDGPLQLIHIDFANNAGIFSADSTINESPVTVAVGETLSFDLEFSPEGVETYTDKLILLDAYGSPLITNLGDVIIAHQASQTLEIQNCGLLEVNISDILWGTQTHPAFSPQAFIDLYPETLASGQSFSLEMSISPTELGAKSGSLHIHAAQLPAPLDIIFSGQAIAPPMCLLATPTSLDFGPIKIGENATKSVALSNCGQESLSLTSFTLTDNENANFEIINAPTMPLSLAVGATTLVDIRFSATTEGAQHSLLKVTDVFSAQSTLNITARAVYAQVCTTPTHLNFGSATLGQPKMHTLVLSNCGEVPFDISGAHMLGGSSSPFDLVQPSGLPQHFPPGQEQAIVVFFFPTSLGSWNDTLELQSSDFMAPPQIELSGTGTGAETCWAFSSDPAEIHFATVYAGTESYEQSEYLLNCGQWALEITGLEIIGTDAEQFNVSTPPYPLPNPIGADSSAHFGIRFNPNAPGSFSAEARILNTDNVDIRIPLYGQAVAPALCVVEPQYEEPLDFGAVNVLASLTQNITLKNCGSLPLTLLDRAISSQSDAFNFTSTANWPYILTPNSTIEIPVRFAPDNADTFTGQVEINVEHLAEPQLIDLLGEGILPAICLNLNPGSLNFGMVDDGTPVEREVTLSNCSGEGHGLDLSHIEISGSHADMFSVTQTSNDLPHTLDAGENTLFHVQFSAANAGTFNATLEFYDTAQQLLGEVPLHAMADFLCIPTTPGCCGAACAEDWQVLINGGFDHTHEDDGHLRPDDWTVLVEEPEQATIQVLENDDGRSHVLDIDRVDPYSEGDLDRVWQNLNINVTHCGVLHVEIDGKLIYQSLSGAGWAFGEWPLYVRLYYKDTNGQTRQWVRGFYYKGTAVANWAPSSVKVDQNTWFHFISDNLLELEYPPATITQLVVGGAGWSYQSRLDGVKLTGLNPLCN